MTEYSYFYDGLVTGDADLAPYTELDWQDVYFKLFSGIEGFVVPEYLDNLNVTATPATNGSVRVESGAAVFYGLYTNDGNVDLAVDSSIANNRVDAVVLEVDNVANTIRAIIVKGIEAANPAVPVLAADQMLLAHVWIPSGFNAATTPVGTAHIWDQRHFMHLGVTAEKYTNRDFMPNGEWCWYSLSNTGTVPDYWREIGTITNGNNITPTLGEQQRGTYVRITCDAAEGMETTLRVPQIVSSGTRTFTVKGILQVDTNAKPIDVIVYARTLGGAAAGAITKRFYTLSAPYEFNIRYELDESYDALDIRFIAVNATSSMSIGQLMVIDGWMGGPFRLKHEWLFSEYECVDAAWNATAKSTGSTTINLSASFNIPSARGIRAILSRIRARDSASLGAGPYYLAAYGAGAFHGGSVQCGFIADNDMYNENVAVVPIDWNNANMPFEAEVAASGAGTLDASIYLMGVIT